MKTEYRVLTSDDANKYRQIRLECLKSSADYFGTLYEDEVRSNSLKFDSVLKQPDSKDFLYGAFQNQSLVGICGFTRERKTKSNHRGEISHMFVKEDLAGQGIGTQLLKFSLAKAFADETLELVTLGVVNTNLNAISVYKKTGFVEFGSLDNYFKRNGNYRGLIFMALTRGNYFNSAPSGLSSSNVF